MKQIVHIFKKDARHYWLEIVLSVAVLAIYVWNEPSQWFPHDYLGDRTRGFLTGAINVAVILSWWLLIVRVVQGESLVGDRQFWTTRPYEWKKLLAAKVLFVAVFVILPMLAACMILLARAGLGSSLSFAPRIFWTQLTSETMLLLPIVALAVVTPNLPQFVLALLAVGAYIGGVAAVAAYVPSEGFSSGSDALQEWILVFGCLAAIVWQYARRKTGRSRVLLIGAALCIFVVVVATPYQTLVALEYPQSAAGALPVLLTFDPAKSPAQEVVASKENEVEIQIPLNISGIAPGYAVSVDGSMLTVEAPDGRHWSSGWKYASLHLLPNASKAQLSFNVKTSFLESVKSDPVKARISLALTVFHDKATRRAIATAGEFAVPDVGLCSIEPGYLTNSLRCRYAFKIPTLLASISSSETTCLATQEGRVPPGMIAHDWQGTTDAEFLSPVETFSLYFRNWEGSTDTKASPGVCPGTPLIFTEQEAIRHTGTEIEINEIKLKDYQRSNFFRFTVGSP